MKNTVAKAKGERVHREIYKLQDYNGKREEYAPLDFFYDLTV